MSEEVRTAEPAPAESFEAQASATGLVLPRRRRLHPWLAVGVVALLVGTSVGIGDLTGWAIGPRSPHDVLGVYGPDQCAHAPSYLSVHLTATVSSAVGLNLAGALNSWGAEFSNWSGDCVHLAGSTSLGDGYVPDLAGKDVDLVATDAAPNATDHAALPATVDLVPEGGAPVAIAYDLPGLAAPLRLDGAALAGLYNGTISSWNDPEIAALNPSLSLAGLPPVTPVYRSTSAGVNLAFTTFLADSSAGWNRSVGAGPTVAWPSGVAAGNASLMESRIASTPGAVGYLEAPGPLSKNVSEAEVENPAGAFLLPSPGGASAAVAAQQNGSAAKARDWSNVSLIDAPGADSYPIVTFVYFALYQDLGKAYSGALSLTNATWLLSFLWWLAGDAGSDVREFGLGTLPAAVVSLDDQTLEAVTYNGGSLLENNEGGEGGETGEF